MMSVDVRAFTRHWPAEEFARELSDPQTRIWLGETAAGACVGYVHVRLIVDEAELLNIAVLPEARRAGAAVALLRHAQTACEEAGARRMYLEVRRDNAAALALYARLGWQQVGIRKGYYSEDGADALVLAVDLDSALAVPPLDAEPPAT